MISLPEYDAVLSRTLRGNCRGGALARRSSSSRFASSARSSVSSVRSSPIPAFVAPRKSRTRKRSRPGNPLNYKSCSRAVPRRRKRVRARSAKKDGTPLPGSSIPEENFVSAGREKRPNSLANKLSLSRSTLSLSPSFSSSHGGVELNHGRFVSLAIIPNEVIAESHDANSSDASNWGEQRGWFGALNLCHSRSHEDPRSACNSLNIAVPNSK